MTYDPYMDCVGQTLISQTLSTGHLSTPPGKSFLGTFLQHSSFIRWILKVEICPLVLESGYFDECAPHCCSTAHMCQKEGREKIKDNIAGFEYEGESAEEGREGGAMYENCRRNCWQGQLEQWWKHWWGANSGPELLWWLHVLLVMVSLEGRHCYYLLSTDEKTEAQWLSNFSRDHIINK